MRAITQACCSVILIVTAAKAGLTLYPGAVGEIFMKDTQIPAGTGFVCGSANHVVTCAHVVASTNEFFYLKHSTNDPSGKPRLVALRPVLYMPKHDLAVLVADEELTKVPFQFGDTQRIRPGDRILYAGADVRDHVIQFNHAIVTAVGSGLVGDVVVPFLEFAGVGVPGYSGGPVWREDGTVVAIMREAWTKKGIKGGQEQLINRAFSIELLNLMRKDVAVPVPSARPPSQTNASETLSIIGTLMSSIGPGSPLSAPPSGTTGRTDRATGDPADTK